MSSILKKLQKRNYINLSEGNGLSCRMGQLVPIYVNHLVPGDTFDIKSYIAARFAPMQAPLSSSIDIKTWGFAIPYRLVWDDADDFFKGKNKRGDDVEPTFPRMVLRGGSALNRRALGEHMTIGSLSDYLDLAHGEFDNIESIPIEDIETAFEQFDDQSVLELRAYQSIYNEYFRDQNVDAPVEFRTDSHIYTIDQGSDDDVAELVDLLKIRKKRWAKDYFTSALPTPSLAPDVEIPIHGDIEVNTQTQNHAQVLNNLNQKLTGDLQSNGGNMVVGNVGARVDPNGTLIYDNDSTIRELTRARMTYQYLLDVARGGAVHIKDWTKTIFNVNLPDYRAMRPEYIGGGSQPVVVSEVLQTSQTAETPQGNMSGRAVSVGKGHDFYYKATEHSIIMIIACVMPKPSYSQGLPKRHFKFDKFDYYLPHFDHVGDQEIKRKELYQDAERGNETFGYAPRFAEYKSSVDRVHGQFRTTLNYWTMARMFNGVPELSSSFLEPSEELLSRPFYVGYDSRYQYTEHVYLEIGHRVDAWRPMSTKSLPIV